MRGSFVPLCEAIDSIAIRVPVSYEDADRTRSLNESPGNPSFEAKLRRSAVVGARQQKEACRQLYELLSGCEPSLRPKWFEWRRSDLIENDQLHAAGLELILLRKCWAEQALGAKRPASDFVPVVPELARFERPYDTIGFDFDQLLQLLIRGGVEHNFPVSTPLTTKRASVTEAGVEADGGNTIQDQAGTMGKSTARASASATEIGPSPAEAQGNLLTRRGRVAALEKEIQEAQARAGKRKSDADYVWEILAGMAEERATPDTKQLPRMLALQDADTILYLDRQKNKLKYTRRSLRAYLDPFKKIKRDAAARARKKNSRKDA